MGPNLHGVIMAMVRVRMMMMRMIMMMMMMMVMMMMMMTKEFSESQAQASGTDLVFKVADHSVPHCTLSSSSHCHHPSHMAEFYQDGL